MRCGTPCRDLAMPGPRGPVTFRDLYLRQFVITPA